MAERPESPEADGGALLGFLLLGGLILSPLFLLVSYVYLASR